MSFSKLILASLLSTQILGCSMLNVNEQRRPAGENTQVSQLKRKDIAMKKFYLGLEERYSMSGKLISTIYLLAERSMSDKRRPKVSERMSVVTQYGYFEAEIEFRFGDDSKFQVISMNDGTEIGTGVCAGPFDEPKSMVDTTTIQQTKEKATAVFSFDGPRIFVAKTYSSLNSGEQTGFSVEKLMEVNENKYNSLKNKSDDITKEAKDLRFDH